MSNAEWLFREKAVLTGASHRPHDPKFGPVFSHGKGASLWDAAGLEYLDFTCGYSATNFGHAFPPLVGAATRQLSKLTHLTQEPHILRAPLAEKLVELCGFTQPNAKVHFNATGSRAIETAWKAAFAFRPGQLISISPSYHGRSLATSPLSDSAIGIPKFVASNFHSRRPASEFAYCSACSLGLSFPQCATRCLDSLLAHLKANSKAISAVIVEPALGARGYIFPPAEYWRRLREVTRQAGIVLIADEIQIGLGRAGAILLSASQGWQPDLVVLGKSLGGGIVPISAVVGRSEVLDALPAGSESETFACTPLAAVVALEVLNQLQTGPWMARGAEVGSQLRGSLLQLGVKYIPGLRVEGEGASAVAEFIGCDTDLTVSKKLAWQAAKNCAENRLLVHFTGPHATRIALLPPLTITDDEVAQGLARLTAAVKS